MFTPFDVIITVIIILTCVSSFIRGGMRDFLGITTLLIAGFLTIYFYPYLFSKTSEHFISSMTASLFAIVPLCIISLVALSIISSAILGNMLGFRLGLIDRTLGIAIGFIKGFAIVALLHFFITLIENDEPSWLEEGQTYSLTHSGAQIIKDIAVDVILDGDEFMLGEGDPEDLKDKVRNLFSDGQEQAEELMENFENIDEEEIIEEQFIDE